MDDTPEPNKLVVYPFIGIGVIVLLYLAYIIFSLVYKVYFASE